MNSPAALLGIAALALAGAAVVQWDGGGLVAWPVAAGLWFLGLCWIYYLLAGLPIVRILVRALLALLPVAGLAAGLIVFVVKLDELDERVAQALIAAIVVASGWVVGFITTEWRRVSTIQERRRDIIRATMFEVELLAQHGRKADWDAAIDDMRAAFQADRRYRAFIFYGHEYMTLKRLVAEIEILQTQQIPAVMDLFHLLDRLDRMRERIDSEAFDALPWERRRDGMVRFLKLQAAVPDMADAAYEALQNGPFRGWMRNLR